MYIGVTNAATQSQRHARAEHAGVNIANVTFFTTPLQLDLGPRLRPALRLRGRRARHHRSPVQPPAPD